MTQSKVDALSVHTTGSSAIYSTEPSPNSDEFPSMWITSGCTVIQEHSGQSISEHLGDIGVVIENW